MSESIGKPVAALFEGLDTYAVEDSEVYSRDDLEEMTKALNESLIKELREAGY